MGAQQLDALGGTSQTWIDLGQWVELQVKEGCMHRLVRYTGGGVECVDTKLHSYEMLQMGSASLKQRLEPWMPLLCSCNDYVISSRQILAY